MAQKWPKNGRPCNYINPYHPILAPPKKCKNVHFLGPKKGVIFTRALFTRLFYLYFWRTGGDIFGKGEKTAPRGHFSTFFPVLAEVMGLSTPILGGLKDGFFGPKNPKNGLFLAHPYDPKKNPIFDHFLTRVFARKSRITPHPRRGWGVGVLRTISGPRRVLCISWT